VSSETAGRRAQFAAVINGAASRPSTQAADQDVNDFDVPTEDQKRNNQTVFEHPTTWATRAETDFLFDGC
jgi:hypothetical protein